MEAPRKESLHYIPARIDATSRAEVDNYFRPRDTGLSNEGLPVQEASLRGRRLSGLPVELPQGVSAHLLSKPAANQGALLAKPLEPGDRWTLKQSFPRFFLWNHETVPTKSDPVFRCMEWLELSKHAHTTVTGEEIDQMLRTDMLQS